MFVYLMTIIICLTWALKSINEGKFFFNKTPLDIPIGLFLASQVLSTIFSIDIYTSIFGYYSRQNGGLLSIVCYITLYYALVNNLNKENVLKLLKVGFISAVIISLWAIPEHFGYSPSCGILYTQKYLDAGYSLSDVSSILFKDFNEIINADCWVQDVQSRVFATLGQPNWLAAYLGMTIFFGISYLLYIPQKPKQVAFFITIILSYLAFTFTYSRGGMIGFLAGLIVFLAGVLLLKEKRQIILTALLILAFISTNLIYGTALMRFELGQLFTKPQTTQQSKDDNSQEQKPQETTKTTQLENGGTESGKIRLIVWQGGLEIFKNYPLFGSGVETFAYAYETHRPIEHNVTSEWDFTYNKAHNEYVNYLATTGVFGFLTYLFLIIKYLFWNFKKLFELNIRGKELNSHENILALGLLAAYVSYLLQNFFSFSVVIIALFFYIIPAVSFIVTHSIQERFFKINTALTPTFRFTTIVICSILLVNLLQIWYADVLFAKAEKLGMRGEGDEAYDTMQDAISLNNWEPFYKAEFGYTAAVIALHYSEIDATVSAKIAQNAADKTKQALEMSPRNLTLYSLGLSTYFQLAAANPKYTLETLKVAHQKVVLAPDHPKHRYDKAIILQAMQQTDEAITELEKAVQLKPNYKTAYFSLAELYFEKGDKQRADETIKKVFEFIPNDPDVINKLESWNKKEDEKAQ